MRGLRGIVIVAVWAGAAIALGEDLRSSTIASGAYEQPGLAGAAPPAKEKTHGDALPFGAVPIPIERIEPESVRSGAVATDESVDHFEGSGRDYGTPLDSEDTFCGTCIDQRPQAWYVRLDSFRWSERIDSVEVVNESGMLVTIGYQRRIEDWRPRLELFSGSMDYDGHAVFEDYIVPYEQANGTGYLGFRGEIEYLIEPESWSHNRIVLGIGTRLWRRRLHNGRLPSGELVAGYDETWCAFYPYLGLETREQRFSGPRLRLFGSARIGLTPFTFENVSIGPTLHPDSGLTAQCEAGVRNERFVASVLLEIMTWEESAVVRDYFQPASSMATLGGRFAYRF